VKTLTISTKEISGLFKKSDIVFLKPFNGLMIPTLNDVLGGVSEKEFWGNVFNEVRNHKDSVDMISLGGTTALVDKKFFINVLSLLNDRSSASNAYKRLPLRNYTKFEKDLFDVIGEQETISRKSLKYFFGMSQKKSVKLLDNSLQKLWMYLWITPVSYSKQEGVTWQTIYNWDRSSTKKSLKIKKSDALEKVVLSIIRSGNVVTRQQVKKVLDNISASETVDKSITKLMQQNIIDVSPKVIINGKKGLFVR
jgi:hypothetical protein